MRQKRSNKGWRRKFGNRLKVAREGCNLTQQQMADRLRMKLDTYQKYEIGARAFPADRIADVVEVTHYGPWFLLTGKLDHDCPSLQGHETGSFKPALEPTE